MENKRELEWVRLDAEASGREQGSVSRFKVDVRVKNCYCPRDGHYCEQPNCENCMFETVMDAEQK